jgi:DNA (cytosine-5)-methyltransferase 1
VQFKKHTFDKPSITLTKKNNQKVFITEETEVPPLTAYYQPIAQKVKQGQCADDVIKGKGFQTCVRPHWNKPCPTIPKIVGGAGYGTLIHPLETRMFTIAELKRLQSFPDDFKFSGKYTDARARIGNSVPPLLMKAIAEHIKTNILQSI